MSILNDIAKIWSKVAAFFKKLKPEIHAALVSADAVLNKIKTWEETTPIGQFFATEVEALIPGLGLALQNYFAVAFKVLKWAEDETGKTDDQIVADGINYLKGITDANVKASQHNTAAALIGNFVTSNNGLGMTIQQHLIAPQVIYNPAVVNAA